MAITLEQVKRLTIIAETKGVDGVRVELERMTAAQGTTGKASESLANKLNQLENKLFPLIKAQRELEKATRDAALAAMQDAAQFERASQVMVAAQQRYAEAAIKAKTAGEAQAEAAARQRQAYIEEGAAIRKVVEEQERLNRILNIRPDGRPKSAADSASVFQDRFKIEETHRQVADARQAADERIVNAAIAVRAATKQQTEEIERQREAYIKEGAAIRAVADAQDRYNFKSGISPGAPRKSAAESASVFQDKFASEESAAKEAARLEASRTRYDQAYKAGKNYALAVKEINELHKEGAITSERRITLLRAEREEYHRVMQEEIGGGRQRGLSTQPAGRLALHQARNLGFQVNDILTGAMSGQSPFMIMAQQGGQVYQILSDGPGGVGGALKRLGSYMGSILTPIRLVGGAFAALGVAAVLAFESATNRMIAMQQALNGVGAASGQSLGGLNRIAFSSAGGGSISIARSQELAGGFANAGLSGAGISSMLGSTRDFAKAFGLEIADAGKELATALRDPTKGAENLNRRFGTLGDATIESIRRAQEQGNMQQAQSLLMRAYNDAMSQVTIRTNSLSDAMEGLKNILSNLWTRFGAALTKNTPEQDIEAAMSAPRRAGGQMSRRMRQNLAMRGIDPEESSGQVETNRLNGVMEAWRRAMEEAGKALVKQRGLEQTQLGDKARGFIRDVQEWEEAAKRLQDRIKALTEALASGALKGEDIERGREALERYGNGLRAILNPMQQIQVISALQIQQTLAETAAQRAAVEAQRAYIEALRSHKTEAEAVAAAEAAVNQARAEGLRQVRDAQRDANNQLELARALPGERSLIQIDQRIRELLRQTDVGATADLPKVFVPFNQGINAATEAVNSFAAALTSATPGGKRAAGIPPDDEWYSRFTNRADTRFNPSPNSPFAFPNVVQVPTSLSPNGNAIGELSRFMGRFGIFSTGAGGPPAITGNSHGGMAVNPAAIPAGARRVGDTLRDADYEDKYTRIVKVANQELSLQNKLLDAQVAAFGKSHAEVATATKMQELKNQAERDGLALTPEVISGMERAAAAAGQLAERNARLKDTLQILNDMRSGISDAFSTFVGGLARGDKMSKVLESTLQSLTNSLLRMSQNMLMKGLFGDSNFTGGILGPLFGSLYGGGGMSGMAGVTISANGNAFSGGNVIPFANGGVVSRPTLFPMANGAGLMGEAGPEAIMPLRRGSNGKLGVHSAGGGGNVTIINENHSSTAKVEQRQERRPDGRVVIRQIIRDEVNAMIAGGETDQANRARYGVAPRVVRR